MHIDICHYAADVDGAEYMLSFQIASFLAPPNEPALLYLHCKDTYFGKMLKIIKVSSLNMCRHSAQETLAKYEHCRLSLISADDI